MGFRNCLESRHSPRGFTVVEMVIVILVIAIMVTAAVIAWAGTANRADLKAAAEIMMQDIRKAYIASDAGYSTTNEELHLPDQYRIVINTNTDSPASIRNSYRVEYRVASPFYGAWQPATIGRPYHTVVTDGGGGQWAKPTSSSDFQIASIKDAAGAEVTPHAIAFVRSGVETMPQVGDPLAKVGAPPVTIELKSVSQNKTINVKISNLGKVWAE